MIGNIVAGTFSAGVVPSTSSYESIATSALTSSQNSITFTDSGAWTGYKHLQLRALVKATNSGGASGLWFANSDTTQSNYYSHFLVGNGSSASAAAYNNPYSWSYSDSTFAVFVMDILDFASTSKYKTIRTLRGWDNNGSGNISLESGLWKNTDAMTSIQFKCDSGDLATYSHFALYGIKD